MLFFCQELFGVLGGQQSEVDSLNLLGNQIMHSNDQSIREVVRKHLDGLNKNWERVKGRALSEPSVFSAVPRRDYQDITEDGSKDHIFKSSFATGDLESEFVPDSHLRYQVSFSDIFDWMVRCEEALRRSVEKHLDLEKLERQAERYLVTFIIF